MGKVKNIFFILLCIISNTLISQTPNYHVIGKEVFKGVDIYSILQHKRKLYVSTNKGLYKQYHNTFIKIPIYNKKETSLFDLVTDGNNDLYCKSLAGDIFKLKNDTLYPFYHLSSKYFTSNFFYFFDELNRMILTGDSILRINEDGHLENLSNTFLDSNSKLSPTFISHKTNKNRFFIAASLNDHYSFTYEKGILKKYLIDEGEKKIFGGEMYLFENDSSSFIFGTKGDILSVTNSTIGVKGDRFSRFYGINNNLLVRLKEKSGVDFLKIRNDSLIKTHQMFNHQFISSVYQDEDNILYLGTFGDGIYVVPNFNQVKFDLKNNISGITKNSFNNPVLSTRKGEVLELNGDRLRLLDFCDNKLDNIFYSSLPFGNNVHRNHKIFYDHKIFLKKIGSIKDYVSVNDSLVLYADQVSANVITYQGKYLNLLTNFEKLNELGANIIMYRYKYNKRYFSIAFDSISNTLLGANINRVVNLLNKQPYLVNNKEFKTSKMLFHQGVLIAKKTNRGLLFIKNNEVIDSVNTYNGLLSNDVLQFEAFNNNLIILSNQGVQVYDLNKKNFLNVSKIHGIGEEPITNFTRIDSTLWLTTRNSLFDIKLNEVFMKKDSLFIEFESFLINDRLSPLTNNILGPNQNKMTFNFDYSNVLKKTDAYYSYQLIGFDKISKTVSATQSTFNYDYVPPGDYTFAIYLNYNNTTSKPFTFDFVIQKPIYQRLWFYILIVLVGLIVSFLIAKIWIRQNNKKNNERLEKEILSKNLLDSELKALRSQMNPHFIFNSLNSIQSLVLKQDTDKSYDYISMFAELVRSTLNYSEQEFISIDKELRFLEVYLDLEKLRFKDDFEYTISYKGPNTIKIPSILVQPFIENSLKHGLLHKEGIKKLDIIFELSDNLICRIIDNGVGLDQSKKINDKNNAKHKSFSMNAIKKRLKILSEQYKGDFNYEAKNIIEKDIVVGTEIVLNMPFVKLN